MASVLSDVFAFVIGGLTVYFDCFGTFAARVGRVPETFVLNPYVIGLALICGGIAALACRLSGEQPDSVFSTILTLHATAPYRGFVVGASVLVLLRSKLFNIQDSAFGGDYLYVLAQDAAIQKVNSKWTVRRAQFQSNNIGVALADPQFESQISSLIDRYPPRFVAETRQGGTRYRSRQAAGSSLRGWRSMEDLLSGTDWCRTRCLRAKCRQHATWLPLKSRAWLAGASGAFTQSL